MSRLIVDSVSARTLPLLDKLYKEDTDKFHAIVNQTEGEPLIRLFKASIARHTVLGRPAFQDNDAARLVEVLVHNNIFSTPGDKNEEEMDETIATLTDNILRILLMISVVRFVLLNT